MKKNKHTESEMVKAIQKLESGVQADVVSREYGISRATLYNWKSKYSGMEVRRITRLKEFRRRKSKIERYMQIRHSAIRFYGMSSKKR